MGCNSSTPQPNEGNLTSITTGDGGSRPANSQEKKNTKRSGINSIYEIGEKLGEGGYSTVKKGTHIQTKEKVAIKICNREGISKEDEQALRDEVQILKELDHPNVISCRDFFEEKDKFYVVLELVEGGELFDKIVEKSFYNEKEARDLVKLLLNTLKYLHDKKIVHRDLKPENLLLKSKKDVSHVKLADFGFAVKTTGPESVKDKCGTPGYIAPEILKNNAGYGVQADMWSFGVIFFILLGGYPPFHDDNQKKLFRKILKADFQFHPDYWKGVSDDAKDLIQNLLIVDPYKRLTVDQALQHKWILKDDVDLAKNNLDAQLAQLKKYQKLAPWRKATNAIIAVNIMKRAIASLKVLAEIEAEDNEDNAGTA